MQFLYWFIGGFIAGASLGTIFGMLYAHDRAFYKGVKASKRMSEKEFFDAIYGE